MGRGRSGETVEIVKAAGRLLEEDAPMTLRQLFYRLVSIRLLENSLKNYQKLSRILTDARYRGDIEPSDIVDRSRQVYGGGGYGGLREYAERIRRGYRKNYWGQQPNYVEVWSEKDAIIGAIELVTDKYAVTVRACRGFMSTTWAYEIADRFSSTNKPIHVLYIGDHDPSGKCIERDAYSRVNAQMLGGAFDKVLTSILGVDEDEGTFGFSSSRIAIHFEDIAEFNLPPLRIKPSDTRSAGYRREHGTDCVELDALPPKELRARLERRIVQLIDWDAWERCRLAEEAECESVEKVANMLEAISNK